MEKHKKRGMWFLLNPSLNWNGVTTHKQSLKQFCIHCVNFVVVVNFWVTLHYFLLNYEVEREKNQWKSVIFTHSRCKLEKLSVRLSSRKLEILLLLHTYYCIFTAVLHVNINGKLHFGIGSLVKFKAIQNFEFWVWEIFFLPN